MSKEAIVRAWCDPCSAEEVKTGATREVKLTLHGKERVLDFCERHEKELIQPIEALHKDWGQTTDKPASSHTYRPSMDRPAVCPACGRDQASRAAAIAHLVAVHGIANRVEASKMVPVVGKAAVCVCGFVANTAGLAVHQNACEVFRKSPQKAKK